MLRRVTEVVRVGVEGPVPVRPALAMARHVTLDALPSAVQEAFPIFLREERRRGCLVRNGHLNPQVPHLPQRAPTLEVERGAVVRPSRWIKSACIINGVGVWVCDGPLRQSDISPRALLTSSMVHTLTEYEI